MRRLLVSLVMLLAWTATSAAAPPAWVASGPEGGSLFQVARSPSDPSTVFAAGDRVWKSTDGGGHWAPYGKRMIRLRVSDLEVGPGPVDNVLIVANYDVYRSTAGGPWERSSGLGEPEFYPAEELARGNANPNLMLAMTAFGVVGPESQCYFMATHRSTDGGLTWVPGPDLGKRCAVPPAAPPVSYDDAQLLMHPTAPLTAWILAIDRSGARSLWRTTDLGHTWQPETAPPNAVNVDLPPPYDTLVAVDAAGVVSHRPVAGGSWTARYGASCASLVPEPFVALALVGCAGSAGFAFAAIAGPAGGRAPLGVGQTFPGLYRETGTGWVPSVSGLTAQIARSATRLGDVSVVMTGDSTYRQQPDGSWAPWTDGIGVPGAVVGFNNVATDAAGRALAAGGKLYRRGPADPLWMIVPTPDEEVTAVSRLPTAAHPLYLVSRQGETISASDDDGAAWPRSVSPGGGIIAIEPAPSDAATAFAIAVTGSAHRLIVTHDRGATWTTVPAAAPFAIGVDPGDAHHLVAMEDMGVVVSHDGGATWHGMLPDPDPNTAGSFRGPDAMAFAFDRDAPGVLYGGTYWDGIWASSDDGLTWGPIPGLADDQAVTSFVSEGAPASSGSIAARVSTWRLYATIGRVGGGFARIDARVRRPSLVGKPHHNGRRTGRIATCSGASVIGAPSATTWFAGKVQIGKGRRFRLPASAVGLSVRCQVQAVTAYATVLRRSASLRPVGRPFPAGGTVRIAGSRHARGVARCVVVWNGQPRSTSYVWRVAGTIRGTRRTYRIAAADAGRRLTCTATAHNRYGRTARTSAAAKVRA